MMFRNLCLALAATASLAAFTAPAIAQQERDVMEVIRAQIATNRQALVAENLGLTAEQSDVFWPIYREFQAERTALVDRRVALLTEFRDNFDMMTDERAAQIMKDALAYEDDMQKLRKKYVKRFEKVLPSKTVLRYFQIENKLDSIINYELARVVPLTE